MNYGTIKYSDIANGEGVRTTLFVSGCTHHCRECFQPETWDFAYGEPFTDDVAYRIITSLDHPWINGLTILGGEPMEPENQRVLLPFLRKVRAALPNKTVWVYTGDTLENLLRGDRNTDDTEPLISLIDVLVDGPFVADQKDITLRFCGSGNQRVIDIPATLAAGKIISWHDDPLFETHSM